MIPGMNSKQAQKMMKQMGIQQEELEASEVIIKLHDRKLVFKNPGVALVNMMGQETFQVSGDPDVEPLDSEVEINEDDVKTVMEQTGVKELEARAAIEKHNGDLAEAILELQS